MTTPEQDVASTWSKYAAELTGDLAKRIIGKVWDRAKWIKAAERYEREIKKDYGTTRIFGQPEPRPLEGIYTDVYVLDKPTAWQRYSLDELRERYAEREGGEPHGEPERTPGMDTVLARLCTFGD